MLHVPPATALPGPLTTGRLSPVSADSSTPPRPSTTTPSVGNALAGADLDDVPGHAASAGATSARGAGTSRTHGRGGAGCERRADGGARLGARLRLEVATERHQDEQHARGVEVHRRGGPRACWRSDST